MTARGMKRWAAQSRRSSERKAEDKSELPPVSGIAANHFGSGIVQTPRCGLDEGSLDH